MNTFSTPAMFSGRKGSALAAVVLLHLLLGYGFYKGLVGKFVHELPRPPLQNLDEIPNPKDPPKLAPASLKFDNPTLYVPPVEEPRVPRDDPAQVTVDDTPPPVQPRPDAHPGVSLGAETPVAIDPKHPLKIGADYYPDAAVRANEQGKCMVQITVDIDGHISQASIQSSTGYRRLDDACLNAVRGARMLPATKDGKPVEKVATMPIVWTLNGR
jgi:periplasmic protein TonB